jgi:hypothetical protein
MGDEIQNTTMHQRLYNELKKKIDHVKITSNNLILILEYIIELVEKVQDIKGNKKKVLAIILIKEVIEHSNMEENEKELCMNMINNGIIGNTIDLVINAANGKLDISQVIEETTNCCFIPCIRYFQLNRQSRKKNLK